jgi:NADH-quinone oxidoreductase subunit F
MAPERPLTQFVQLDKGPRSLTEYESTGGYEALKKALREMTPKEVTDVVTESKLRGRGGGGFTTGTKWCFVPLGEDAPHPKYLVANGDEMEPGTFKDRLLIEGDPHELIEGMIIASYALEADAAYIFLRWEYREGAATLRKAIAEAYHKGYLGKNILGSGYSLNLYLHTSAGRYICGEEMALINSLEGKRANPRAKPPFPPVVGLWGKSTTVNNVETLCNVSHIVKNGAEWFRGLSLSEDGGTKLYGASGRVKKPGIWELPMGTTAREIIEEHAGGMQDGYRLRAVIPGGASTEFILEEKLDVKMDFASVAAVRSRLGTGTMIVLDDKTCPVGMVHNLEHFFAQESCGWCTPCWAGLQWAEQILKGIEDGEGRPGDIEILESTARKLAPGNTFCALAPGAVEPLQSAIWYFRDDFERHIRDQRCTWR